MADKTKQIFTIGTTARMLEISTETLIGYERDGLINPMRQGKWRYFTKNDIKWIQCVREMIHVHGISIKAVKKLLRLTLCWNISECPFEKRQSCTAFLASGQTPLHASGNHQVLHFHNNAA